MLNQLSIRSLLQNKERRLLPGEQTCATLRATPEVVFFHYLEFACIDHSLKFLLVALFHSICPHCVSHGSDEKSSDLETCVDVVHRSVWHVAGHPDTGSGDHIVLALEFGWELVDPTAQEKVVMLSVKAALADRVQEVGRDVKRFQVHKACVLHSLPYDARSRADIQADSIPRNAHAPLGNALGALVDDVLGLCEVDDTRPLVVALRCEAGVPLRDVFLLGQIVVELVDNVPALLCPGLVSVGLLTYRRCCNHVDLLLLLEFLNLCHSLLCFYFNNECVVLSILNKCYLSL